MQANIKIGTRTAHHANTLQALGYKVDTNATHLLVEVAAIHTEEFAWTTENVAALVKARKALCYTTPIRFSDGKVYDSIIACGRMGKLSCLMMNPPKAPKAPKTDAMLDEILALVD